MKSWKCTHGIVWISGEAFPATACVIAGKVGANCVLTASVRMKAFVYVYNHGKINVNLTKSIFELCEYKVTKFR